MVVRTFLCCFVFLFSHPLVLASPNWTSRIQNIPEQLEHALPTPFTGIDVVLSNDLEKGEYSFSLTESPLKLTIQFGTPTFVSCFSIVHQLQQLSEHANSHGVEKTANLLRLSTTNSLLFDLVFAVQRVAALETLIKSTEAFLSVSPTFLKVCSATPAYSASKADLMEAKAALEKVNWQRINLLRDFVSILQHANRGVSTTSNKGEFEQLLQALTALHLFTSGLGDICSHTLSIEGATEFLKEFKR